MSLSSKMKHKAGHIARRSVDEATPPATAQKTRIGREVLVARANTQVVEQAETATDVVSWDDLPAVLPAPCLRCDGQQLVLVHINVRKDTKTQRCVTCGALWETPIS